MLDPLVIARKCGAREVFPSDMMDENPANLVTGKVKVLPFKKYKALSSKEQRDPNLYYFKEYFKANKLQFCGNDPVADNRAFVKEDFPIDLREYWLHFFSQQPDEWTPAKIEKYVNIFVEHEIRESSIHLLDAKFLSEVMKITIGHDILKIIELRDFMLKTKKESDLNIIDDSTPPARAKRKLSHEFKAKSSQQATNTVAAKKSHERKVKKEIKVESESNSSNSDESSDESDEVQTRERPTLRSNSQRRASQEKLKEIKSRLNQDRQRANNNGSGESQSLTPSTDSPTIKVPAHLVKAATAKQSTSEPVDKNPTEGLVHKPALQSSSKPKEAPRIRAATTSATAPKVPSPPVNTITNTNAIRASNATKSSEDITTTVSPSKTKTTSPFAMLDNMKDAGYKFSGASRSHVNITPVKASSFSAPRSKANEWELEDFRLKNKAQSEPRLTHASMGINKLTPKKNVVLDDDSDEEIKEVNHDQVIYSNSATPRNSPERHQVYDVDVEEGGNVADVEEAPIERHQEYTNEDEHEGSETHQYTSEYIQPNLPVQRVEYYHANVSLLTGGTCQTELEYSAYLREGHAEDRRIQSVLQQVDKNTIGDDHTSQLLDVHRAKLMSTANTAATADMFHVEYIESSPSPVPQKLLPGQINPALNRLQNSLHDMPNDPFVNNMYSEHSDPLRYSSESFCSQADASQITDSQLAAILPTPLLQQQRHSVEEVSVQVEEAVVNVPPSGPLAGAEQSNSQLDQSRDEIRPWQSQREVESQYIDDALPDEVLSQLYEQYEELSQPPPVLQRKEPVHVVEILSQEETPAHIRNRDIATQPQPQVVLDTQLYSARNSSHEPSPNHAKKRKFQEMIQISSSSSLDSDEEEFSPIPTIMPTASSLKVRESKY